MKYVGVAPRLIVPDVFPSSCPPSIVSELPESTDTTFTPYAELLFKQQSVIVVFTALVNFMPFTHQRTTVFAIVMSGSEEVFPMAMPSAVQNSI